jgi:hypothetical protein
MGNPERGSMFDRLVCACGDGYLGILSSLARRPLGKCSILSSISALCRMVFEGLPSGGANTNLSLFPPCYIPFSLGLVSVPVVRRMSGAHDLQKWKSHLILINQWSTINKSLLSHMEKVSSRSCWAPFVVFDSSFSYVLNNGQGKLNLRVFSLYELVECVVSEQLCS